MYANFLNYFGGDIYCLGMKVLYGLEYKMYIEHK